MTDKERRIIENRVKVEQALDLLYSTHIEDDASAVVRGKAVRAVNDLHMSLGGRDLIAERERR